MSTIVKQRNCHIDKNLSHTTIHMKVASWISSIFSPYTLGVFVVVLLWFHDTSLIPAESIIEIIVILAGIILIPAGRVAYQVKSWKISNHFVDDRLQRRKVYLIWLLSIIIAWGIIYTLYSVTNLLIGLCFVLWSGVVAFLINTKTKISIHMVSVWLTIGFIGFALPWVALGFIIIGLLVWWSRYVLRKHTVIQIMLGVVTGLIFWLAWSGYIYA